jgi:hypothetical protein
VVDVGELRRGVVAPDRDPADVRNHGRIRRRGELSARAIVVEPGEGAEALAGDVGADAAAMSAFVFAGFPDDDADVVGGDRR